MNHLHPQKVAWNKWFKDLDLGNTQGQNKIFRSGLNATTDISRLALAEFLDADLVWLPYPLQIKIDFTEVPFADMG